MTGAEKKYRVAIYCRLSREDGDKAESDSILNQQRAIEDFCGGYPELEPAARYVDDGWTGTNFDRPGFKRMLADIEAGKVDCVVVKDLSRLGRDYVDMGFYLERVFAARGVRFIAINDAVDSGRRAYDMLLPIKNIFNAQYAKDISAKVRSAFRAKQRRGEFCGAFASFGYLKAPTDRNRLVIDPAAAETVQRIFRMAAGGMGKQKIADALNADGLPSPGEYKRLMGTKYRNTEQPSEKRKWTYAAVDRVLRNELYIGNMVANRKARATMHGKETANDRSRWVVVEGTHDAIISRTLWDTVQAQMGRSTRGSGAGGGADPFAGFLRCGDCGASLSKTTWNKRYMYCCGAYQRRGAAACAAHYISEEQITEVVLCDLNRVIRQVKDIRKLAERNRTMSVTEALRAEEQERLEAAIKRVRNLKLGVYEDYKDGLLERDEYLRYRADYDEREKTLVASFQSTINRKPASDTLRQPWIDRLIRRGELDGVDRMTVAQNVKEIRVFEDKRIEITYLLSTDLRAIIEE